MKSKVLKILATVSAFALVLSTVLGASAAKYVANVVTKPQDYVSFVQPGDLNADNSLDGTDVTSLKGLILKGSTDTYSDVNGDGETDICDLVLQDEQPETFVDGSAINLNGKSVYKTDLSAVLNTGAKYKITFETSGNVTVKLSGITDIDGNAITTTATDYVFKTPLTVSDSEVKLEIIGNGTVENFKLARVDMDNDASVS